MIEAKKNYIYYLICDIGQRVYEFALRHQSMRIYARPYEQVVDYHNYKHQNTNLQPNISKDLQI